MAATIRDIAKMTGLSLATVSKYLNGGNVLTENRALIQNAIEELHYEVNEVARGLAKNCTKTIGVLIHNLDNIFAGTIIAHIEDILRQHDYGTIVCDCRGDKVLEEQEIKFLLNKRVDGIITIPTSSSSAYLANVVNRGIPVVLIDRTFEDSNFDSVLVDNSDASYRAVCTLIDKGHSHIGIICGDDSEYTARERLAGYYKALEASNISIDLDFVKRGSLNVEHGYNATKALLTVEHKPTALYLSNYEITLGAIIAINELGIGFPTDISIIGFDNMMLSQVVKPKLWMVVQPIEEIASSAANIMLERLSGALQGEAVRVNLDTSLLTGESVKQF
ncbi:MAG: LacI family DNA-binding transcriptional regulator [Lachnotalea sp.]